MIVLVRCPHCNGPLDLNKPFNKDEWTAVRVDKVEDVTRLRCHADHKGGKSEKLHSGTSDGPLPGSKS